MDNIRIFGHSSYIGTSGISHNFRDFFRALSSHADVKIRNFTVGKTWKGLNDTPHDAEPYINDVDKKLLNVQSLWDQNGALSSFPIYQKRPSNEPVDFHIVGDIVDHHYFYDKYFGPKVAYIFWESTLLPQGFFKLLRRYDEVWVPSKWQKDCMVMQGYKESKIQIIPSGVDTKTFYPENVDFDEHYSDGRFKFVVFGRWSRRKGTQEMIRTFLKTFKKNEPVDMIISVDTPLPDDEFKTTYDKLKGYGLEDERIKVVHFPSREDYIKFIKKGHVFVSCSRGEGWNLPLMEAMACGTPSIYSNCCAQVDFANGKGHPVKIAREIKNPDFGVETGNYYDPDWDHLSEVYRYVYENYKKCKEKAMKDSVEIREKYDWETIGEIGYELSKSFLQRINVPRKKRLLFVAPHLSTGGMPQYLEKKIKLMMEEFEVYCIEYNQISTSYVVQRNRIISALKEKFYSLHEKPKENLLELIDHIEPDIINFEEFPETFVDKSILKNIYTDHRKYTILETSHGIYFRADRKKFFPDKYLFVSEFQADTYSSHNVPSEIIEYPIEKQTPKKVKCRKELGFSDEYKHIINVGLFTPGKNQKELIEYAKELSKENIKFHFIGNTADNFSDYWKPLLNDLPENCIMWGERDDIEKFYQAADLMVFTSIMETSPLVIRESISWGLPCLIYNLESYKKMYDKYDEVKYLDSKNKKENIKLIKSQLNLI
jgi:glycosyltransferase involved in cell wall biosynthesis